jgi:hypothetical protein
VLRGDAWRGVALRCNGWCGAVVQLVRQESKRVAVQDVEKLIVKTKKVTQRAMNPSDNMEVGDIHIGYKLNSLGSLMLRDSVSASFYCDFKLFAWWCVHPCTRSHMLRVHIITSKPPTLHAPLTSSCLTPATLPRWLLVAANNAPRYDPVLIDIPETTTLHVWKAKAKYKPDLMICNEAKLKVEGRVACQEPVCTHYTG